MAQFTLPTKATVDRPRAKGYDGFINDYYFRLLITNSTALNRQTAAPAADQFNTEVNPEDIGESFGKTYSRLDFTGGEGLDLAHRRDMTERDLARYWDSRNVEIRKQPGSVQEIMLLRGTEQVDADTYTSIRLVKVGGTVFYASSKDVLNTADPMAASPTVNNEDPHDGEGDQDVLDLAALGNEVYAAITTNGIHKRTWAGVWSHWSDLAALRVWGVKGRVLASTGTALYEAAAGAGSTLLATLPPGQTWNDVIDAGAAILAAASDGYIYAFADESTVLTLKAQTLIEGETPQTLGEGQGVVFYTTTQSVAAGGKIARWWRGVLSESFTVVSGQVIKQWGLGAETVNHDPSPMFATRDSIYVGLVEDATETHLWRYDFLTTAVSRNLIFTGVGKPMGLTMENERLIVTLSGLGLYREASTYASEGWLIGPAADFYTARDKQWVGARMWVRQISSDEKAVLLYTIDPEDLEAPASTGWVEVIELANGEGGDERSMPEVESRWLAAKIVLTPNTGATVSPRVRGFAFRAYPGHDDVVVDLPIHVGDAMERPNRRRVRVRDRGEQWWAVLRTLEGKPAVVELFRPPERIRGIVESVGLPITMRSERGSATLVSIVKVRGYKETVTSGAAGAEVLGVGALGVELLGGAA